MRNMEKGEKGERKGRERGEKGERKGREKEREGDREGGRGKGRGGFGAAGLHTTARELQTRTFEGSGASNTTKIPREDTQRDKKSENGGGRGKKSAKFWAPTIRAPTLRGPALGGPTFSGFGPSPFKPSPCVAPPSRTQNDTHQIHKRIGQKWIGKK